MTEAPDDSRIEYVDAPELSRYEIRDGDILVGFTQYRLPDDVHVDFVHTEVDDEYDGRGLASEVVKFALDDVRSQGKRVIPHCRYVARWITKHPDYEDITDRP
ncbi:MULTISPECIES: GNAT family N-acetyltransferase [Nocardioides]|uniref:GNAT family N-acetyltransferase n=1 Tax=Nocardioides vastitatis TaxID=2568655 RepID=A0ABW0ZNN8_9ACTN|nr:GNAT family N-acetyltransferase [Nocardioides sp.]THJ15500.1 N-acetyltransferase [Nocardioides sp.]